MRTLPPPFKWGISQFKWGILKTNDIFSTSPSWSLIFPTFFWCFLVAKSRVFIQKVQLLVIFVIFDHFCKKSKKNIRVGASSGRACPIIKSFYTPCRSDKKFCKFAQGLDFLAISWKVQSLEKFLKCVFLEKPAKICSGNRFLSTSGAVIFFCPNPLGEIRSAMRVPTGVEGEKG